MISFTIEYHQCDLPIVQINPIHIPRMYPILNRFSPAQRLYSSGDEGIFHPDSPPTTNSFASHKPAALKNTSPKAKLEAIIKAILFLSLSLDI